MCVLLGVFFGGFPWASCVSQDHGKVRVRERSFACQAKSDLNVSWRLLVNGWVDGSTN